MSGTVSDLRDDSLEKIPESAAALQRKSDKSKAGIKPKGRKETPPRRKSHHRHQKTHPQHPCIPLGSSGCNPDYSFIPTFPSQPTNPYYNMFNPYQYINYYGAHGRKPGIICCPPNGKMQGACMKVCNNYSSSDEDSDSQDEPPTSQGPLPIYQNRTLKPKLEGNSLGKRLETSKTPITEAKSKNIHTTRSTNKTLTGRTNNYYGQTGRELSTQHLPETEAPGLGTGIQDESKDVKASKSCEGVGFCFTPSADLATEVTVTIEPEEPDVLDYALDNGIMPIICGYMPPSAAPVIPEMTGGNHQPQHQLPYNHQHALPSSPRSSYTYSGYYTGSSSPSPTSKTPSSRIQFSGESPLPTSFSPPTYNQYYPPSYTHRPSYYPTSYYSYSTAKKQSNTSSVGDATKRPGRISASQPNAVVQASGEPGKVGPARSVK